MDQPFFQVFMQNRDNDPNHTIPQAYPRCVEITDGAALMDVAEANHLEQEIKRMVKEAHALQRRITLAQHRREAAKIELFTKLGELYPAVEESELLAGTKFMAAGESTYYVSWDAPSLRGDEP